MTQYAKYQNLEESGVYWLPRIPSNWNLTPIRHIFKIGRGRVIAQTELIQNGKYPVYSSQTKNNGLLGYIDTWDFDCDQVTWTTDGANAGSVFLRSGKHNCTNVCGTLQPKSSREINLRYCKFSLEYSARFYKRPDTNGAKIMNGEMAAIPIVCPPIQEQTAIANFLDDKTAKIDRAIAQKERLIALLKERKQILIQNAVTKGLDPSAKMIDSNEAWIGEVPRHWEVSKLGLCLKSCSERNHADKPLLSITREKGVIQRNMENPEENHNFIPEDLSNYKLLKKGQFGMNKMKAWQGSYGISDFTGIVSPAYYTFTLREGITPEYFSTAIRSKGYIPFFGRASDGVRIGQWDLSRSRMKEIPILIPPVDEQIAIADFAIKQSLKIDVTLKKLEASIETLREYRATLIDSAVTGKIKVPGV